MQDNCRITTEQLSKEIGLSASACQRRINKLREEGIIAREVAILSKEKISPVLTTIVEIALERETPNIMDDFKNSMLTIQEVTQCYYVTGEIDFILILNVRDIDHYQNFTQKFLFDNPNIRRFNTLVVMETVKQRERDCVDLESDMFEDVNVKVKYKSTTNQVEIGWFDDKANFFKKLIIRDSAYVNIKGHFQNALDFENSKKGPFETDEK